MSELITYLNELQGKDCLGGIDEMKFLSIEKHFMENFGVTVRREEQTYRNDLFLFKYHQLEADWSKPLTHECRGCIVRFQHEVGWTYMSRPFDKFFNLNEGHCPISPAKLKTDDAFLEAIDKLVAVEKVDGSLIQLWYDDRMQPNGMCRGWRISTSGSIIPKEVDLGSKTFEQLFCQAVERYENQKHINIWRTWDELLDRDFTYMFELCTPENIIVNEYDSVRVVMLAKRNKNTGEIMRPTDEEYDTVERPKEKPIGILSSAYNGIDTFIAHMQTSASVLPGHIPEGWVLYDKETFTPVAKMKCLAYVNAHRFRSSNWHKALIIAILEERIDDIEHMLRGIKQFVADKWKDFLAKASRDWMKHCVDLHRRSYADRKAYAQKVGATLSAYSNKEKFLAGPSVGKSILSFMLNNAEHMMEQSDLDVPGLFTQYMRKDVRGKTNSERLADVLLKKHGDRILKEATQAYEDTQPFS